VAGFGAKSKQIGERTFTVRPLPFGKGREGLRMLLAIIAPSLGDALAAGASVRGLVEDSRLSAIVGGMLGGLSARFDEGTLKWFEEAFGEATTVDIGNGLKLDKPGNRESAFSSLEVDRYLAYSEWLGFALEVNYRDFFTGALEKLKDVAPKKPQEEPKTS
jgi:hypothetical protein